MESKVAGRRILTIFSLAMINVAAVGTIRGWPVIAEFGFSSIFYLLLAALVFFIPVSMISAELATTFPKAGGIFFWVKEAFGQRTGFLAIWLLWIENVVWYPIMLSFIASMVAYIINPTLATDPRFTLTVVLAIFWITTLMNLLGMRVSSGISTFGVIFGTFLPGLVIIGIGMLWYFSGRPTHLEFDLKSFFPNSSNLQQLVFFAGVIQALSGMEMSAVHVNDVINPRKNFPLAILLSAILIFGLTILGVLSIAIVIPQKEINLVSGLIQAFSYFMNAYGLSSLVPWMAVFIGIGAFGGLSTWIVGPSRGLLAAAQNGDLPPFFRKVNRFGMPVALLITQATIVSLLSLLFVTMPSVSGAYWILSVLMTQLYVIMYILMFASAIKLRMKRPDVERPYRIPGGMWGMWLVGGIGILSCLFTLIIGFFPQSEVATGSTLFYIGFLAIGILVFCLMPYGILLFKKPSWSVRLSHEK